MRIVVPDHKHPVAELIPVEKEELFLKEASQTYSYRPLQPLTTEDTLKDLTEERSDRWQLIRTHQ